MTTRQFTANRLAALTVLAVTLAVGSQAFVPSAYGCGTTNSSDCRTSTNGGGTGKVAPTESTVMTFLNQVKFIIDAGAVLIP